MKKASIQTTNEGAAGTANSNTKGELFPELSAEKTSPKLRANVAAKFTGTDNPRHLRGIHALMQRPRFKNDLQAITGASNTPELVAELRRRGLETHAKKYQSLTVMDWSHTPAFIHSMNKTDARLIRG